MSNPANKADTQTQDNLGYEDEANTKKVSFADKVNEAVSKMVQDDKGVWQLPEGIKEEALQVAVLAEKRFRDTQSAFTRAQQKTKALEAENSILKQKATENVQVQLTDAQSEELEELKFSDPEMWRKKMNTYETNARNEHSKAVEEEVKKITTSTLEEQELERREAVLSEFLKDPEHKGFELNEDIIANDIPPRITNKLVKGTITFEQFLQECYDYSKTGKVIKQNDSPHMVNLSKVGGGDKPDANAMKEDAITSYSKEIY